MSMTNVGRGVSNELFNKMLAKNPSILAKTVTVSAAKRLNRSSFEYSRSSVVVFFLKRPSRRFVFLLLSLSFFFVLKVLYFVAVIFVLFQKLRLYKRLLSFLMIFKLIKMILKHIKL